jgi:hypothetical protein
VVEGHLVLGSWYLRLLSGFYPVLSLELRLERESYESKSDFSADLAYLAASWWDLTLAKSVFLPCSVPSTVWLWDPALSEPVVGVSIGFQRFSVGSRWFGVGFESDCLLGVDSLRI